MVEVREFEAEYNCFKETHLATLKDGTMRKRQVCQPDSGEASQQKSRTETPSKLCLRVKKMSHFIFSVSEI